MLPQRILDSGCGITERLFKHWMSNFYIRENKRAHPCNQHLRKAHEDQTFSFGRSWFCPGFGICCPMPPLMARWTLLGPFGGSWKQLLAVFWRPLRASWAHFAASWTILASKILPKPPKNRCKHRLKNCWLLGSVFYRILPKFGHENGAKLAPKSI